MPRTNPTATASAISQPRSVKMPNLFGSLGMLLDRTHAELALTRLAQRLYDGSQFTVKRVIVCATEQSNGHVCFGFQ